MKIQIIGTGSSGNCIKFSDSVLLDVGVPFKDINERLEGVKIVLLTHCHADHFNKTTIRKIYIKNNGVKFYCGEFLKDDLLNMGLPEENIVIVAVGEWYRKGSIKFSPVKLYHDTPNVGYRIIENDHKHVHFTDTFTLDGISAKNYDSATIECNHEIDAAKSIIEQKYIDGEFSHLKRTIETHLSVDKAIKFIKDNNIKQLIPVHMGSSTAIEVEKKLAEQLF